MRGAVLALAAGVRHLFWYDLLDDGSDPGDPEQQFGLLRQPDAAGRYTPKPAYVAYAVMARQLSSASFVSSERLANGIYDEVFSTDGAGNLQVLWSTTGAQTVTLATVDPLTVVGMTGQAHTYRPANGRITLTITGDPCYVRGMRG